MKRVEQEASVVIETVAEELRRLGLVIFNRAKTPLAAESLTSSLAQHRDLNALPIELRRDSR